MFPGREFCTRLPAGIMRRQLDFEELFQHELQCVEKKMQRKGLADGKKGKKASKIQAGDAVLVKQESSNKATPPFEKEQLEVQHQKGMQVVTKTRDGCTITRSMAHFKKAPYQTSEKARRWKPRPESTPKNCLRPMQSPLSYHRWRNNLRKSRYRSLTTRTLRALGTGLQSSQQSHLSHTCLRKPVDIMGEYLSSKCIQSMFYLTKSSD